MDSTEIFLADVVGVADLSGAADASTAVHARHSMAQMSQHVEAEWSVMEWGREDGVSAKTLVTHWCMFYNEKYKNDSDEVECVINSPSACTRVHDTQALPPHRTSNTGGRKRSARPPSRRAFACRPSTPTTTRDSRGRVGMTPNSILPGGNTHTHMSHVIKAESAATHGFTKTTKSTTVVSHSKGKYAICSLVLLAVFDLHQIKSCTKQDTGTHRRDFHPSCCFRQRRRRRPAHSTCRRPRAPRSRGVSRDASTRSQHRRNYKKKKRTNNELGGVKNTLTS